jgi:hypothetical protein
MSADSLSSKLIKTITRSKKDFFYVNGDDIQCVISNLKFVYSAVIGTESLISCAIEQLKRIEPSSYRNVIISYLLEHLDEEFDHARWLSDDLNAHGVNLTRLDNDAMFMIGAQYYMIHHETPYCLLGYMAVAEGTPTPISEIEKMEQVYGRKLFRFSRFHSIKDQEHKHALFKYIDSAPTNIAESITRSTDISLECMARAAQHWV